MNAKYDMSGKSGMFYVWKDMRTSPEFPTAGYTAVYSTPSFTVNGFRVPELDVVFVESGRLEIQELFRDKFPHSYTSSSFAAISEIFAAMFGSYLAKGVLHWSSRCFSEDRYGTEARRICGLGDMRLMRRAVDSLTEDETTRLRLAAAVLGVGG